MNSFNSCLKDPNPYVDQKTVETVSREISQMIIEQIRQSTTQTNENAKQV